MPQAKGHVTVNSKQGRIEMKAKMEKLTPATQFGPQFPSLAGRGRIRKIRIPCTKPRSACKMQKLNSMAK
jgi:hypothetical protein